MFYALLGGAAVAVLFTFRSRHSWRLDAVGGVLAGIFIPVALVFLLVVFIAQPSFGALFLIVSVLVLPGFLLVIIWWETGPADPFTPVSGAALEVHAELGEGLKALSFQLRAAAAGRRSLGIPSFIYVRRPDQLVVLVVGKNPATPRVYVYSEIADHLAYLCTAYTSGTRAPGELRQRLPSRPLSELLEAHQEAANFLERKGLTVQVEMEEDPLDLLRLLVAVERQNRRRPLQLLFGAAFGDVLDPLTKPLAQQRKIEQRIERLPAR